MVANQCLAMGNGSIKAQRTEENTCLASIHTDPPCLDTDILKMRITYLEAKLTQRDQEVKAQELQLQHLQRELEAKVCQIDKLQDAIGYNSLGRSPPGVSPRRFSVINQGPSHFHRVAMEVHRRLKAKEGVSAEPTSENFCGGRRNTHISMVKPIQKDLRTIKMMNDAFMKNDFLKRLEPQHLREMANCMYENVYTEGQLVIQEGESGNYLYVLADGLLEVIQSGKLLGEMRPGTAFGELAILYNCKRTATVKAVTQSHIWALDRRTFQIIMMRTAQAQHEEYFSFLSSVSLLQELPEEKLAKIVDCLEIDYFEKGEYIIREGEEGNTFFIIAKGEVIVTQSTEGFSEPQEIKTLGVGDYFGEKALISEDLRSANIICNENDTRCLVVDRELFRTFRDNKCVYMLLEVCLGGELWTVLRDMNYFDEPTARFCTGCVLEAFDYLHTIGIVYRDLKPENLLLDAKGYVKMADFGFAKKIGLGKKTWTFCGTPEYVAPEVIMNKGHDFGADCWSLGILIFELLTGNPPFAGPDPIKIYTVVLYGIEKVDFPKRIGKRPDDLIRRLCKLNPVQRLGNKKNGITDIKKHKWFQGFNWEGLRRHKLLSPLKRELKGPMDHSHFDIFPADMEVTPDETSGWDKDF
ncbi:cGMP-dependent protein kinase 2 isoform X5 [Nerophis lumbriciformis]|uniref:cGMP-dependent protein kinase 2 isoform X5 n=1 Tax=Nerophis lumbriciformis TaxID=546530 RepID=UPI002AE0792E|nr:cGMP-dependent protein kinase 2-like isoform X5 [Nerophis lumbriciformis]